MGRSNPWGDLDQMWHVETYCGRNHLCNISWLSVKGCGCDERGKFAFSDWRDVSPLQHWSHYRVTVCMMCPKMVFLGGLEGEDVKILYSNPPKNTALREYASVGVSRVKIGSTAVALGR